MHTFAQTNIQLINQLRRNGRSPEEIAPVLAAYELAMRLFTGLFRASGKTFIAHMVGTSSILAGLRAPPSVVAAGMLHSAYSAGDFGDGRRGVTSSRRDWMRSQVGAEIEELVNRYTKLKWTDGVLPQLCDGIESLDPIDRNVLLMRLANELEEFLDLGVLYGGEEKQRRAATADDVGRLITRMAEKLGYPELAMELREAFAETAAADVPPSLRRADARNFSFLVAPQSYQRIMDAVAKRIAKVETPKA